MNFDLISGGVSVVAWEICKQILGAVFKRAGDKHAAKRQQLSAQCAAAKSQIHQCLQDAVEYLTADCSEERKIELGRSLRHELSLLGQSIRDMNLYAQDLQVAAITAGYLVSFRQAVTWHIDSRSYKPKRHDSHEVSRAYQTGLSLQEELTRLQLASA